MPRDLFSSEEREDREEREEREARGDPPVVASPESQTPKNDHSEDSTATGTDGYNEFTIHREEPRFTSLQYLRDSRARTNQLNDIHPYVQTLSISDLKSCVALENAVFPEHERCSREKFHYRLATCPELTLGIFTTIPSFPASPSHSLPTYPTAHYLPPPHAHNKQVLIAMICCTKTTTPYVTDGSMAIPPSRTGLSVVGPDGVREAGDEPQGHQEAGRTICIHTLGVLPEYQKKGLGKILMKSFQQRMEGSGIADRISLIARKGLVALYTGLGFEETGMSKVQFGGGEWEDLGYEFTERGGN